jgi:tetratricopeptide (TPR) repeat protein
MLNGEQSRAIIVADDVLETAEQSDLVEIVADTLATKGTALAEVGRATEGVALLRAARDMAASHGFIHTLVRAWANWASAEHSRDPHGAVRIAREGLAEARRLGHRGGVFILLSNAVFGSFRVGEWQWAIDELDAALSEGFESSDRAELLDGSVMLHAFRGDPVDDDVAEIQRLIGDSTDAFRVMTLEDARGWSALAQGRFRDAHDAWQRAASASRVAPFWFLAARAALWSKDLASMADDLAAYESSGWRGAVTDAELTTIRAGVAGLEGRTSDALQLYREALGRWRELRLHWDEALGAIDMATVLGPDKPEVVAATEAARETLTRLGAKPFLERLASLITGSAPVPQAASVSIEEAPTAARP